jgi:cell wall-associated NlpC family hydrolase
MQRRAAAWPRHQDGTRAPPSRDQRKEACSHPDPPRPSLVTFPLPGAGSPSSDVPPAKGSLLHSTTKRFRRFLIIPSTVFSLSVALLAATATIPGAAPAAEAATPKASVAVVKALTSKANATRTVAGKAARTALAQRGDMYLWGAEGPNRFDCSGLMLYAYKAAGRSIPRTSYQQRFWTRTVPFSQKRMGDMAFYNGHVAMYLGNVNGRDYMIHAPRRGQPVQVVPLRTSGLLKIGRVR